MVSGSHLNLGCLMDLLEEGGEVGGEMEATDDGEGGDREGEGEEQEDRGRK
jgi:hypothetical protein